MAFIPATELDALLKKYNVPGVSIAVIQPGDGGNGPTGGRVVTQVAGKASVEANIPVFAETNFEIASLSKTLGAAFMIEYFEAKGVQLDANVNELLRSAGSKFQLRAGEGNPAEWAEQVTLSTLCDHSGLGMHYVNGVPLSKPMPSALELISGTAEKPAPYGYASLDIVKQPGTKFGYSGGGFIVLQHLLETMEGKPIADIMAPFLAKAGTAVAQGLSFHQDLPGKHYAVGYKEAGEPVQDGRLMFPPLAAGGLGSPAALADWLRQLAIAYKRPEGCGGIKHTTARKMLIPGPDKGSDAFMHALMGVGVFVFEAAEAGQPPNKWMLHQAANDGFRGLYLVCFDGPDAEEGPKGFVLLSSSDNNAMFLNCAVTRKLLQSKEAFATLPRGLDWSRVMSMDGFSTDGMKQAEIVNLGLMELCLKAFVKPVTSGGY